MTFSAVIVAAGATQSWFGHDEFAIHAPGMKSIDDALELRGRIFGAYEFAEVAAREGRPDEVADLMTFVVVGAGPTGVEMAGQIRELANKTLTREFRHIDSRDARVILLDGAPAVLATFGDRLGGKAKESLEDLGVEVILNALVVDVDHAGLVVKKKDGTTERIESACKVWAAGVQGNELGRALAQKLGEQMARGAELDAVIRARLGGLGYEF